MTLKSQYKFLRDGCSVCRKYKLFYILFSNEFYCGNNIENSKKKILFETMHCFCFNFQMELRNYSKTRAMHDALQIANIADLVSTLMFCFYKFVLNIFIKFYKNTLKLV